MKPVGYCVAPAGFFMRDPLGCYINLDQLFDAGPEGRLAGADRPIFVRRSGAFRPKLRQRFAQHAQADNLNTTTAMADPMMMSGHGDADAATAPAASSTPQFEMTSLREHSNVLFILRSWHETAKAAKDRQGSRPALLRQRSASMSRTAERRCWLHHIDQDAHPQDEYDRTFQGRCPGLPAVAAGKGIQADAIDQRVAQHVGRIGHQCGGARDGPAPNSATNMTALIRRTMTSTRR